uniref:Uncharacterized protein n=1 Tax=Vespula pensylvanica TaxID=30213 RepID=A0A834P287_VESPE|nr:hypothetical protein H0235_007990 [Vespula pensylvanica]
MTFKVDYTERKRKVQQEIDLADTMKIPTMRYISIENGIIMLLKSLLSHTDRRNEGKSRNILAAIEKEDEIFLGDKGRKYEIRFMEAQFRSWHGQLKFSKRSLGILDGNRRRNGSVDFADSLSPAKIASSKREISLDARQHTVNRQRRKISTVLGKYCEDNDHFLPIQRHQRWRGQRGYDGGLARI